MTPSEAPKKITQTALATRLRITNGQLYSFLLDYRNQIPFVKERFLSGQQITNFPPEVVDQIVALFPSAFVRIKSRFFRRTWTAKSSYLSSSKR